MTKSNNTDIESAALKGFEDALDQPSDERRYWVELNFEDSVLRNRILDLLRADETQSGIAITGQAVEQLADEVAEEMPERIGQYRIERIIGRGGMGVVYLGQRDVGDFDHSVAIKVVRGLRNSPKLMERLRTERQTLAQLQHANIAQLFDGGETQNGDPYFLMEFVEGHSLREQLQDGLPDISNRLHLFSQICNAVQYAHQKLIVHRDLSPQNILVSSAGDVKLIDFGISQSLSAATDGDEVARFTMTKGYAAPERLRGEAATTLGDIYGLGVILKEMIGKLSVPRESDLMAIADRACADDPAERYQSVGSLLDDLSRYRRQQPVSARGDGWRYRFSRYLGRHRIGVGLGAASIIGLVAATLVMSVLYVRAEQAEQKAAKRFDDVRSLANFVLFDLYDDLDIIPGTTGVRGRMADRSRQYLDQLAEDKSAPIGLRIETALGYKRLGDVLGNPMVGNLGRREDSLALIDKAYEDLKALLIIDPDNEGIIRALAETTYSYSVYAFIALDDNDKTIAFSKESQGHYQTLLDGNGATLQDRMKLFASQQEEAAALVYLSRGEEALTILQENMTQIDALAVQYPDDLTLPRIAANIRNDIAGAIYQYYEDPIKLEEGIAFATDAISRYRALAESDRPDAADIELYSLSKAYWERGRLVAYLERDVEAIQDFAAAEAIVAKYSALEPEDKELQRRIITFQKEQAASLAQIDRIDAAIGMITKVVQTQRLFLAEEPDDMGYFSALAEAQANLAEIQAAGELWEQACTNNAEAMLAYDQMDTAGTLSPYLVENILPDVKTIRASCVARGL